MKDTTANAELVRKALAKMVAGEVSPAELLGVEPRIVDGLYAIGAQLYERGEYAKADRVFQRCVMLEPFRSDFWIALALARHAQGRPMEAGDLYQVAGLMTEDPAPVAYAAACFAEAGQIERARTLAEFLWMKGVDTEALRPWLAVVDAAAIDGEVAR